MDKLTELLELLNGANNQIELVRICYKEIENDPRFETEYGQNFKHHLAETIKNGGLAQLCLGIVMLEDFCKNKAVATN